MKRYQVIVLPRAANMMCSHIQFLSKVSIPAAKKLEKQFIDTVRELEENPFQFPIDQTVQFPECSYRKALFGRNCKVLFYIEEQTVFMDAVVDCRMNPDADWRKL